MKTNDMKPIAGLFGDSIEHLNKLTVKPELFDEIMNIINEHSSELPAGTFLASDPVESFLHERAYEDVVKDIIDLVNDKMDEPVYVCPHCGYKMLDGEDEDCGDCGCPSCRRIIDWSDYEEDDILI